VGVDAGLEVAEDGPVEILPKRYDPSSHIHGEIQRYSPSYSSRGSHGADTVRGARWV
jgi:hypothetical protein